jgi:hypothetical protein
MSNLPEDDFDNSPVIAVDDLVFACTSLCDLLEIENDALSNHDAETVKILADNKHALTRLYERAVAPLVATPELAETLEPEQREELIAVGTRLKDLVETNAVRLKAEMEAYERVMEILATKAKTTVTSASTYGRAGTFDSLAGQKASLSYNKAL